MKSERRHELDHNELLDWLTNFGNSIKPYVNYIILGLCLLAVAIFVINWTTSESQKDSIESSNLLVASFDKVRQGGGPEDLDRVANAYPDTGAGAMAMVIAADLKLNQGIQNLSVDKELASEDLKGAIDGFNRVIGATDQPIIRERARFGLGQAEESLGQIDAAKKEYESLVKEFPEGAYTESARSRLNDLERSSTVAFIEEFNKFDPKKAEEERKAAEAAQKAQETGQPISPSGLMNSGDTNTLPSSPGSTFGAGLLDNESGMMPTIGTPSVDTPAPATETPAPAVETPAPATETPAPAVETPAPATETPAPAVETPAPTTEAPAPAEETPAPATETPAPAEETPAPATEAPAPAEETPAPATDDQ